MPEVKLTNIIEWVVTAAMLAGITAIAASQHAALRYDDLAARSEELLHASESLAAVVGNGGVSDDGASNAARRAALARVQTLLAGDAEPLGHVGSAIGKRSHNDVEALRREAPLLRSAVQSRLTARVDAARELRAKSGIIALAVALTGWLLFVWCWRRSGKHERINSAITRQLRRYVQELERARSVETETAADLMRLNDELAAAKNRVEHAMEARAQVMARISHDIRTPLSGIVGMSQFLLEGETNPAHREYVLAVHSCANSLTLLLNDVLDLSKAESGKVVLADAPFDLHALCSEIANLFRAALDGKPVQFEFSYSPDTPRHVVGDEQRLRQVITNLVGNAVKFTSAGTIGLSVVSAVTSKGGRRFRIKVTDTGIGIRAERMQRIFDPYEQADPDIASRFGGTGLGLSICKHLAELMKGSIEVASVYGQGSVFTLTVPLVPAVAGDHSRDSTSPAAGETASPGVGLKVLVADDNRVNQTVCRRVLEKLGASVDVAGNGLEVLGACATHSYDLILMDCNMPELDGYEAARCLRQSEGGNRMKIVALTADGTPESRRKCFDAGMDDWLVKPLRVEALRKSLSACEPSGPLPGQTSADSVCAAALGHDRFPGDRVSSQP